MRNHGWSRDCMCGGVVEADPMDPAPGVRAHNRDARHKAWSDRTSLMARENAEPPSIPTANPEASRDVSGLGLVRPDGRRLVAI